MRTEANGFDLPPKDRPQIFDPGVLPVWRRYAKLRTQLYPYLRAADRAYQRSGLPAMRHLALAFPNDPRARARDDEYMFGPDLLAAPVLEPGARTRSLYLPRGPWVDLWRSASLDRGGALVLRRARVLAGRRGATLPAPLAELPLLARAGTLLPLLPADVDTLAGYGHRAGLVHLADRRKRLGVVAFPRGRSSARSGASRRLRSVEGDRTWSLTLTAAHRTRYALQASLATLRHPFTPCAVTLAGHPLPRTGWTYDATTRVLRARFATRHGTLVARTCGG
jgi:hypothetical protein